MTIVSEAFVPPCAHKPDLYLDAHVKEQYASTELSATEWEQLVRNTALAHRQCAGCPLLVDCLYRAVVEVDVFGYAACTTEADRQAIRSKLGIEVTEPSSGPLAAPRVGTGPVDHEVVLTTRAAHPKDTCVQLAERIGCSTSTVKRHLRRARESRAQEPQTSPRVPTVDEVLDCFDELDSSKIA